MHRTETFEDTVAHELEQALFMRFAGEDRWREAKIQFIKWFCQWTDKPFAFSTNLCFKRWCEYGHEHERTEWTMLNVLCLPSDESVETSLYRFFTETVLSEDSDRYENKPCHAVCPECASVQKVIKKQKILATFLPEIFAFQLRDTGVGGFKLYIILIILIIYFVN
jgi:hypothetical protein